MRFSAGDKHTIPERLAKRYELMQPLMQKLGYPLIVHAVDNQEAFLRILKVGKLMPLKAKANAEVQRKLGYHKALFFSVGFVYATAYDFKYNLLFSPKILANADYYKRPLIYQCYLAHFKVWKKKDTLKALAQKTSLCRNVVDKYNIDGTCEFWKIERHLREHVSTRLCNDIKKKLITFYPASRRHANNNYATDKSPEIIIEHDVPLDNLFVGFYINGTVPKNIRKALMHYSDKLYYDGQKICFISQA